MNPNYLHSKPFSRILLIKPSALGDVVHTVPALVKLRARYPQARIDWLITRENAEIIRCHPALSNAVIFPRQGFGKDWRATTAMLELLQQLRRAQYDLVIDLHGQLRSIFFGLVTGCKTRIGFDRPGRRSAGEPRRGWRGAREGSWLAYTHRIPIPTLDVHAIDRYLWIAPMLGLDDAPPDGTIYLPPETAQRVDALLERHGVAEPVAAIVPGTIWETKHWRVEGFADVARYLISSGFGVVLLGVNRDRERCREINAAVRGVHNLCGQTSPAELASIIERAGICVTNDSGSMHLAVALRRPVVSIFGPTNPRTIGPYHRDESVVRLDLPCSPCNFRRLTQCPYDHRCMRDVSANMVIQRIERELQSAPSAVERRSSRLRHSDTLLAPRSPE